MINQEIIKNMRSNLDIIAHTDLDDIKEMLENFWNLNNENIEISKLRDKISELSDNYIFSQFFYNDNRSFSECLTDKFFTDFQNPLSEMFSFIIDLYQELDWKRPYI